MRKGVVLVIVMGVMLIIFTLALVALFLMTQESRVAEHKIKRMRGYFAAKAGVVDAYEQLRKGSITPPVAYNIPDMGQGLEGYPQPGLRVDIVVIPKGTLNYNYNGATYDCQNDVPSDNCIFSRVNYQ